LFVVFCSTKKQPHKINQEQGTKNTERNKHTLFLMFFVRRPLFYEKTKPKQKINQEQNTKNTERTNTLY